MTRTIFQFGGVRSRLDGASLKFIPDEKYKLKVAVNGSTFFYD